MLQSSVFGRLTGKRQQGQQPLHLTTSPPSSSSSAFGPTTPVPPPPSASFTSTSTSPTLDNLPELDRRQTTGTHHRRESSILSLANSVSGNVRRSVSLRSHRTNPSSSSSTSLRPAHYPRNPSSSNLANSPQLLESPETEHEQEQDPGYTTPPPPRSRGKLSISARSFSNRFKSSENLPILPSDGLEDPPPVPQIEGHRGQPGGMLAAPSQPRRPPPEKPSLTSQPSFQRELTAPHNTANGFAPLQNTTTAPHPATNNAYNPSTLYQSIRDVAAKRIATIDYMRKVHDGNVFYYSTLLFSPATLATMPSWQQYKLGRRATSYMVLGYSLPTLLDLNSGSAMEYLKAFSALLAEFETYQNLVGFDSSGSSLSRGRVGQMFKSSMGLGTRTGKGRRSSAATDSVTSDARSLLGTPSLGNDPTSPLEMSSPVLGHEFQHLLTPHLPFDPDFSTTYATLCDTLVDTYAKLMDLITGPEVCSPSVGDAFAKVDKAVRKILVANVVREFEDTSRAGVKSEIAGLGKLVLGGLM